MEGALAQAEAKLAAGRVLYEKDIQKAFYRLLKKYEKEAKAPLSLRPYFMVLHSGVRMGYPSLPGNFRITRRVKSVGTGLDRILAINLVPLPNETEKIRRCLLVFWGV